MSSLRKNIASQLVFVQVNSATTGAGITSAVSVNVTIDTGSQTAGGGTATHMGGGQWKYAPTQAETNGACIGFQFVATGAISANATIYTDNWDTSQPIVTSGTGADQLSVSSGKILLQATQSGVTIPTVTTVTNQLTAAAIATGIWQDTTAGDFTTASSIGKSLYTSGVVPGGSGGLFIAGTNAATTITTALTTTFTGSLSGSVASVTGAVGSVTGLTASNLDTTVSSRMATYTQPTGFLAATFPTGTVANTTNITAGTITTTTNLTNAPTAGDFTATMKASIGTSVAASAVASVTGNVGGNVTGSVGSVVAAVATTSNVKKNQGLNGFQFVMTDSTTHAPKIGVTVTAVRSLDGGAFSACANAVTEIANGWYTINLAASDLNANTVALRLTGTSADDRDIQIVTQP